MLRCIRTLDVRVSQSELDRLVLTLMKQFELDAEQVSLCFRFRRSAYPRHVQSV